MIVIILVIMIFIIVTIVITPAHPHKHDQAGGHGPALFWPLKLPGSYTLVLIYYGTLVFWYFLLLTVKAALLPGSSYTTYQLLWYFGTFHC